MKYTKFTTLIVLLLIISGLNLLLMLKHTIELPKEPVQEEVTQPTDETPTPEVSKPLSGQVSA